MEGLICAQVTPLLVEWKSVPACPPAHISASRLAEHDNGWSVRKAVCHVWPLSTDRCNTPAVIAQVTVSAPAEPEGADDLARDITFLPCAPTDAAAPASPLGCSLAAIPEGGSFAFTTAGALFCAIRVFPTGDGFCTATAAPETAKASVVPEAADAS